MCIIVYSNGIIEEHRSEDHTFTEEELLSLFDGYNTIRSKRLSEIPNTWCLWGIMENPPNNEFHKIASEINHDYIFSHIIFIHDTEINLDWNLIDIPIYDVYENFAKNVRIYIDDMAQRVYLRDKQDSSVPSMIFLVPIGHTEDKRVLYGFNPHEQSDTFFSDGSFTVFADKIYDYLIQNFEVEKKEKPFKIFADSKNIVISEDLILTDIIDEMIKIYQPAEKYERCSKLAEIKKVWKKELKSRLKDDN